MVLTDRLNTLKDWVQLQLGWASFELTSASSDASFRHYYRVRKDDVSYVVMDAPPQHEDCQPFIHISRIFLELGLHVPEVLATNLENGFLLLEDLGSILYLDELNTATADRLYGDALGALAIIQSCGPKDDRLPAYTQSLLLTEMTLFQDWLIGTHLGLKLDVDEQKIIQQAFDELADSALQQPQVCVHRDFHSRNLMLCTQHNPGVIDFQDAVVGPVTYDLVSLLRDCYIEWPRERVEQWASGYFELAGQTGILDPGQIDEQQFLRWFDWMGVQRHLKAAGIFARLNHRDGKPGYLADIPRTLGYVTDVCRCYPELSEFGRLVEKLIEHS